MSGTPGLTPERVPAPDEDRLAVAGLVQDGLARSEKIETSTSPRLPLAGLRVLEVGHYTTAPLSARHLATLGADVIKIEPEGGEAVRDWPPAKNGIGYFFNFINAGKRSLAMDLETPRGIEVLQALIGRSDVLIENLKPGALAKRGFSAEAIARINPRLIYCAVSGFGADTIYAGRPAFDTVIQAMCGLMDLTRAGDVPVKSGISSADLLGAEMAVVAILAAVAARDRTGLGQSIDLSMQDVGAWLTMPLWNRDNSARRPIVLAAIDGYVMVEIAGDAVDAAIQAGVAPDHARSLSRQDLAAALSAAGYRAAPVLSAEEMLHSEQTRGRRLLFHATGGDGEAWPMLASPLRLKDTPPVPGRPMGALGSDGTAILAELEAATGKQLPSGRRA